MAEIRERGLVRFIDRRLENTVGEPDSGTVELIYEPTDEPDTLRSKRVAGDRIPEGLARGAVVEIVDADGVITLSID